MKQGEAARRWRDLVRGRSAEMNRLQPGRGDLGPAFWDKRARRLKSSVGLTAAQGDPFLARLKRAVRSTSTVLDVGAGPGRFTLAIAPRTRQVTAVDPSRRMLGVLRRRAREQGLGNIKTVLGKWQEVDLDGLAADVVICSHVLTLVDDPAPFLRKLGAAAAAAPGGRVMLYVSAFTTDAVVDPFWRHFHGSPRRPGPSYLDAVAVLKEIGIDPAVEVVEIGARSRYETVADAVENYRDWLVLPDTKAVRQELVTLLEPWLQRDRNGTLRPPVKTVPSAILSWTPAPSLPAPPRHADRRPRATLPGAPAPHCPAPPPRCTCPGQHR